MDDDSQEAAQGASAQQAKPQSDPQHDSEHDRQNSSHVRAILQNPTFQLLVHKKRQLSWSLALLLLVIYFGFITLVAIAPDFMHRTFAGGVITYGIPLGIGVILIAFVLCGIYVWRANGEFDRLTQEVVRESQRASRKEQQS
jgi:uncharacterized membrane protein (DUF485 family)